MGDQGVDLCLVRLLQARSVRNGEGDLIPLIAVSTGCTGSKAEAGHAGPHSCLTNPTFGLKPVDEIFSAGLTFEPIRLDVEVLYLQKIAAKNVEHLGQLLVPMSGLCGLEIGESVIAPGNLPAE